MVRGTVNGGGGLVLGSTGPLAAGRAHSEGGNGGLDSGEHWGRSREWTKKKQQKLTDSLRFFVTKGRDDDFLFWVSFFTHYGFTDGLLFFFSMFFFSLSLSFYRPFPLCALAGSGQMLDGLGNGVVWGGGCRVLGTPGGWFLRALNKRDQ